MERRCFGQWPLRYYDGEAENANTPIVRDQSIKKVSVRVQVMVNRRSRNVNDVLGRKDINISNSQAKRCSKEVKINTTEADAFIEQMVCL